MNIEDRLECLEEALVRATLSQKWQHKYAKFGKRSQSLFAHSLNAFSVARILGEMLFDLSEDEIHLVSLAAFLHDFQKAEEFWQQAAIDFISGARPSDSAFKHDSGSEEMRAKLKELLFYVGEETKEDLVQYCDRIFNIMVYTHDSEHTSASMRRKREVGPLDPLTRVVRLSDSIASIKEPKEIRERARDPDIPVDKNVEFEYHELTVVRGVISSFLNEAVVNLMKEAGYVPLLYFGNGAVYILVRECAEIENPRKRIQNLLNEQFGLFQESDTYRLGMSNAVIGPLTQTKWPCLHLVREEDVATLVDRLISMPAANKPEKFGQSYYKEQSTKKAGAENKQAMDDFAKATGSLSVPLILAEMTSDFNLLVYVFDFLKRYRKFITDEVAGNNYEADVDKWLRETLGDFTLDSIRDITHTSPVTDRTSAVATLWKVGTKDLHRLADKQKRIMESCTALLKRVVRGYRHHAPPLIEEGMLNALLSEIAHLPSRLSVCGDSKEVALGVYKTYARGKSDSRRICNFCGLQGEEDAVAGLFGDGSEKFTNFLPGGINLGAGKKAQVCTLCQLEATLRAFFFQGSPHGTIFIMPDLSLSPSAFKTWSKAVDELVRTEHLGLGIGKSWNMLNVYKTLAQGKIPDTAEGITRKLRPTKNELKELVTYLSSDRESIEDVDFDVIDDTKFEMTFEGVAAAHMKGIIRIDPYLMEGFSPRSQIQRTALFTPSHFITFLREPLRDVGDEAPSTSAIRTFLLSLIIAEVFHAKVMFVEGYQPVEHFDMKGRINIQMPAPAENALKNLGLPIIVDTHQFLGVLRVLTSLVLVSMSYVKGLGKDRLLRMASMNRGAILRRAQMEAEKKNWDQIKHGLIGFLENLPAKVGIS